jgi:hypothetical protein
MGDKAGPAEGPDKDQATANKWGDKKRPALSEFILLAATVIGAIVAILLAAFHTLTVWTVVLVIAGFLLALAVAFTGLAETKWFYPAAAWVIVAALIISGIYIAATGTQTHSESQSQALGEPPKAPELSFVLTSPATVPWCNAFDLTTKGTVPSGYEILVFDASIDAQDNATSPYSYDGVAKPVSRVPGEWVISPLYVGAPYKQVNGQNILSHGKPVSNAGYTVGIFAVLVPDSEGRLLHAVTAYKNEWGLKALPTNPLVTARLDTVRNGDAKECPGLQG